MSEVPESLRYAETHEWVRQEDDGTVTIGITDHAQEQLGDLVFIELPETGRTVDSNEEFAVVESVKAASEVYAICSGEVVAVNDDLPDAPTTVNENAESDGWLYKVKFSDASELDDLMSAEDYQTYVKELDE